VATFKERGGGGVSGTTGEIPAAPETSDGLEPDELVARPGSPVPTPTTGRRRRVLRHGVLGTVVGIAQLLGGATADACGRDQLLELSGIDLRHHRSSPPITRQVVVLRTLLLYHFGRSMQLPLG